MIQLVDVYDSINYKLGYFSLESTYSERKMWKYGLTTYYLTLGVL